MKMLVKKSTKLLEKELEAKVTKTSENELEVEDIDKNSKF